MGFKAPGSDRQALAGNLQGLQKRKSDLQNAKL